MDGYALTIFVTLQIYNWSKYVPVQHGQADLTLCNILVYQLVASTFNVYWQESTAST